MKKSTIVHYDQIDVQKIVRGELRKAEIAQKLEQILERLDKHDKKFEKIDHLIEVVDRIAGDIRDYREEQELNAQKLSDHSDQLEDHAERLKKVEHPIL